MYYLRYFRYFCHSGYFLFVVIASMTLLVLAIYSGAPAMADNAGLTEYDTQPIVHNSKAPEELKIWEEFHNVYPTLLRTINALEKGTPPSEADIKILKKFKQARGGVPSDFITLSSPNVLGVQAVGQETTYYCGPASAVQLLKYKGITRHPTDGRSTTQANLATDLHTTQNGTPFPGWWVSTLNSWTNTTRWASAWGPSESYLLLYTWTEVQAGWPLIYDTHMNSTNGYLPGYNSGDIYHYVTGDGYELLDDGTWRIHYVDPNKYRSGAFGPHWVTLNQMWKVVRDRGIIW